MSDQPLTRWPRVPLGTLVQTNPVSLGLRTPPDFRFGYIDLSSVCEGSIDWLAVREQVFRTAPSRARRAVQDGDVLFGTVRPCNRSHAFVERSDIPLVASTGFTVLRPMPHKAHPRFVFHYVLSDTVLAQARRAEVGSNYPAVTEADVAQFSVPAPPVEAQRRIAQILDTVDEAIRKTEEVIAKLQQMKQGLLHDLLTRGIDENGELRDPERHPEQFKDSPLGRIPRRWRVETLGEVIGRVGGLIQTGPFGSQLHAHEYVEDGVPVVMPQDIHGDQVDLSGVARITERKARELRRHRVRPNDAIFSRRGDLGRCHAVVAAEEGWLCGTGCLLVRASVDTLSASWLTAVYRHDWGQRQVLARAVGSTMANLNGRILRDLVVPVPPLVEQEVFSRHASALQERVREEQRELKKLHLLKQGLMDDLLTGRVRVPLSDEPDP